MEIPVCAGGFLVKKNKFLFGKRSSKKTWAPNMWDIVGGHSLKEELPLDTLKRETFEEIGVKVLSATLITSVDILDEKENKYFRYHIYMITSWKGKAYNRSKEHTKVRWFTIKQLSSIKIALNEYLPLLNDWLNGNAVVE